MLYFIYKLSIRHAHFLLFVRIVTPGRVGRRVWRFKKACVWILFAQKVPDVVHVMGQFPHFFWLPYKLAL